MEVLCGSQKKNDTRNEEKQKVAAINRRIDRGGGGFEGLVLLGGALATATLVASAAFVFKRVRPRASADDNVRPQKQIPVPPKLKDNDEDDQGDGLNFPLQDSPTSLLDRRTSSDGTTSPETEISVIQINSRIQSLILDEKLEQEIKGSKDAPPSHVSEEIYFHNNVKRSDGWNDSNFIAEDFSLSVIDSQLLTDYVNEKKNVDAEGVVILKEDDESLIEKAALVDHNPPQLPLGHAEDQKRSEFLPNQECGDESDATRGDQLKVMEEQSGGKWDGNVGDLVMVERGENFVEIDGDSIDQTADDERGVEADHGVPADECLIENDCDAKVQDSSWPMPQKHSFQSKPDMEMEEIIKLTGVDGASCDAVEADLPVAEEIRPRTQLIEKVQDGGRECNLEAKGEEEDEEEVEDDNEDKSEEMVGKDELTTSEGTGGSSMNSNDEAILPAEAIQKLEEEQKKNEEEGGAHGNMIGNSSDSEMSYTMRKSQGNQFMVPQKKEAAVEAEAEAEAEAKAAASASAWIFHAMRQWKRPLLVLLWCFCCSHFGLYFTKISLVIFFLFLLSKMN